jgi:hypothetical protein
MPQSFELYMISISWENSGSFSSYKLSEYPLEHQSYDNGIYQYDIVIYTKENSEYYQFCLKTSGIPILRSNDENNKWGFRNQLHKLENDLWIIKGDWDIGQRGKGYCKCPSINTVGKIHIGITYDKKRITEELIIDVNPNIEDFDFEILKNDFEGELWDLLTSNKSKSNIQTNEVRYGDKTFRFAESKLIIDFLNEFTKISNNPKRELKYTTVYQSYEKVKPVPATFKQLAVSGISKSLPSKSHIENFDIYENRLLCLMLYKIAQIINYNLKFSSVNFDRLQNETKIINEKINELNDPPQKNPQDILDEIKKTEEFYNQWLVNWNVRKQNILNDCDNLNCDVNSVVEILYNSNDSDYWGNKDGVFSLMRFSVNMSSIFESEKKLKVKIKGHISESGYAGSHPVFTVTRIEQIEFIYIDTIAIITRQKDVFQLLKNNNWKQILSHQEKEERNNQILTLKKRLSIIYSQIDSIKYFNKELTDLKLFIDNQLFNAFKPSMTFIQNIKYRNAFNFYKEILKSKGIDIEIFGLFELITNYGIREIPQVYELWCLISIIKILETNFGFKHNASDLQKLLTVITPDSKKIDKEVCINFSGDLNGRTVKLYYQKQLLDYKRPDFLIELRTNTKTVNLILDAKFKNYNYKSTASIEAKKMHEKYGTYTFTLHPTSDKSWNEKTVKLTNFGGDKIYDENNNIELPFHKYGFLMIKPNQTDNLKKIVGMSFEYLIENEHNAKKSDKSKDPKPELDLICLSCGNTKVSIKQISRGSNRFHYVCQCENTNCGHNVYIDYCWNCKTKLYKHGSYWDYHKTSMWSIFDIHCPNCGMTVADKPK